MRRRCGALSTIMWSKHSRRIEPISRSTNGFCQGLAGAETTSVMPHVRHSPVEALPVDAVTIAMQPFRHGVVRKGLDDLLSRPRRGRMLSDIEVHDAPTAMRQHDQHDRTRPVSVGTVKKS